MPVIHFENKHKNEEGGSKEIWMNEQREGGMNGWRDRWMERWKEGGAGRTREGGEEAGKDK